MNSYFRRLAERATGAVAQPVPNVPASAAVAAIDDPFERVIYDPPLYPSVARTASPRAPNTLEPVASEPATPELTREAPRSVLEPEVNAITPHAPPAPLRRDSPFSEAHDLPPKRDAPAFPPIAEPMSVVRPPAPEEVHNVRTVERSVEPPPPERIETRLIREREIVHERIERLRAADVRTRAAGLREAPTASMAAPAPVQRIMPAVEPPAPPEPSDQPRLVIGRLRVDVVPAPAPLSPPKPQVRRSSPRASLRPTPPRVFGLRQT